MDFPQATLEEIVASESAMVLMGRVRFGQTYDFARNATIYLTQCITSFDHDRRETLARLLALAKKHQILAFLSALRLHRVQTKMDLRQVLEAGSAAAFAIANPQIEGFVDIDEFGIMDPSQGLAKARYRWLADRYPSQSEWLKRTKTQINEQTAHANIISGDSNFRLAASGAMADTPFFDIEDEHFVKTDLWLIGRAAVVDAALSSSS
jgi:hypothetical protein